jgi:hypothetical protein
MQHAITLECAPVSALNVELGPDWLRWMADFGLAPDQPAHSYGGAGAAAAGKLFQTLDTDGYELAVEALTGEILSALCRPRVVAERRPRWLEELPDLLDGELGSRPSLRDLAAKAGGPSGPLRGCLPPALRLLSG